MRIDLLKKIKYKSELSLVENSKLNHCDYRTFKKYHEIKDKRAFWAKRNAIYYDNLQIKIEKIVKNNPQVKASRVFSILKNKNELQNNETKINYSERTIRRRVKKARAKYNKKAKNTDFGKPQHS